MKRGYNFWSRLALVGGAVWVGLVEIASVTMREFRWFPDAYRNDYSIGPAGITAFVGVAIILALCLAVPWLSNIDD